MTGGTQSLCRRKHPFTTVGLPLFEPVVSLLSE